MSARLDLRPEHETIVRDVLGRSLPEGVAALAFGSRVAGKAKPYSDLDLALKSDAPLSLELIADLSDAFCESDLPFRVDLLDLRSAAPALRARIERDGVAL